MLNRLMLMVVGLCLLASVTMADKKANASKNADPRAKLVKQAVEQVSYFDFSKAAELFEQLVGQSDVGSEYWQIGIFGRATCLQQISPYTLDRMKQATDLYKELISKAPKSKYSARAMMNLGRIAELRDVRDDKADLPGARKWYQKVIDGWSAEPIASEATLRLAATYIQTYEEEEVRKGISILEKWLAVHPSDALASVMLEYLGDTYFYPLKDYVKSVDAYRKADKIGFAVQGTKGSLYWRIAVMAERYLKDRDVAVEFYTKIIRVVPTSGKAYEAQLALKRLGAPVPRIKILEDFTSTESKPAGKEVK